MLNNDTLKNGTSRIGLYGSAPPPPPDDDRHVFLLFAASAFLILEYGSQIRPLYLIKRWTVTSANDNCCGVFATQV